MYCSFPKIFFFFDPYTQSLYTVIVSLIEYIILYTRVYRWIGKQIRYMLSPGYGSYSVRKNNHAKNEFRKQLTVDEIKTEHV